MGSDPEPFFDNLFLFYHERHYINNLKKKNVSKVSKCLKVFQSIQEFCCTFRFIDGQSIRYRNIYPTKLEPKKKKQINKNINVLDLNITI